MNAWQRLTTLALVVIFGAGVPAAAAQETTLRFKFRKGDQFTYHVVTKMDMVQMLMGKEVELGFGVDQDMHWTVREVEENGAARMVVKYGRSKMLMTIPGGKLTLDSDAPADNANPIIKNLQEFVRTLPGIELTLTVQVNGELSDIRVTSDALRKIKGMPGMEVMASFFSEETLGKSLLAGLVLPSGPVSKGKQWAKKNEMKTPLGTMEGTFSFVYQGTETRNRKEVEVLAVTPDMTLKADPKSPLTIKTKVVEARGYAYFDAAAGRLVEMSNNLRLEISVQMQGVSVTQQMSTATTIELK